MVVLVGALSGVAGFILATVIWNIYWGKHSSKLVRWAQSEQNGNFKMRNRLMELEGHVLDGEIDYDDRSVKDGKE